MEQEFRYSRCTSSPLLTWEESAATETSKSSIKIESRNAAAPIRENILRVTLLRMMMRNDSNEEETLMKRKREICININNCKGLEIWINERLVYSNLVVYY